MKNIILPVCFILILIACRPAGSKKTSETYTASTYLNSEDSLIAALSNMPCDTLDCRANTYWEIVGKGQAILPYLIDHLTDTGPTPIYHGCKGGNLNIGELCYFAMTEIGSFPAFVVTNIQFDVVDMKSGWNCWSFYDYLFSDGNKTSYQKKASAFYQNSKFQFVPYPDSVITDCMRESSITGRFDWVEFIEKEKSDKGSPPLRLDEHISTTDSN